MQRCSVLISTCDKYKDAWDPFFSFFIKYWPDCPYDVYINTESESYSNEKLKVDVINYTRKNSTWSQRLKHALKTIKTEYIVFLLEDFFFLDYIKQDEINKCIGIMDKHKDISVIDFEVAGNFVKGVEYEGIDDYYKRDICSMYFLNCQAAIWRRKDLIKFLSPYESPWQFEIFGSERVKLYSKNFLIQKNNECCVFNYNVNWDSGYGIHGGKWLRSNVEFFKDNNIAVDFDNMGFYKKSKNDNICLPPKSTMKYRLMYLLFSGGYLTPKMSLPEQIKMLFKSPRQSLALTKYKLKKCFKKNIFEN